MPLSPAAVKQMRHEIYVFWQNYHWCQPCGWANNVGMKRLRQFASDNYSGVCPEAWAAMAEANAGHEVSYGNDAWTQKASDLIREIFETDCEVFFVFNGT